MQADLIRSQLDVYKAVQPEDSHEQNMSMSSMSGHDMIKGYYVS